ncbi:DUF4258 domain-containing protein [Ferruginibacter albus]|uniref:DUF4258 domain-containing protein n=1 Tax=Ferruginibacter albus TaxID=2875540 RepID=UPI001CC403AB|nr:DUF4258 domain-containing protein [Ferruginibacter albus]UAY51270.1 DUF4258 domain-containing protein [Ferruginibacter albus]
MLKKYLPLIILFIAACAIWFIKSHQRGHYVRNTDVQTINVIHADSIISVDNDDDFNRSASKIIYSKHAKCRMDCRHIDEAEVKAILKNGKVNEKKIEEDDRGKTYPLEGVAEGHHLRIVFAPKENDVVEVVTCIDLDTDWDCDCK